MKKITLLIMSILLVGTLGAISLSVYQTRDKELASADYDVFEEYEISGYEVSPIVCRDLDGDGNNDECDAVKIVIEGVVSKSYNPEPSWQNCTTYNDENDCIGWETIYYTDAELETKRDTWEDSVIKTATNYLHSLDDTITEDENVVGADVTLTRGK